MDKILKAIFKTLQSKLYRCDTNEEMEKIGYTIEILELSTEPHHKEFKNLIFFRNKCFHNLKTSDPQ